MSKDLLKEVVDATGLPTDWAQSELVKLLHEAGANPENFTLDQLREILADQIGEALLKAKEDSISSEKL